MIVYELACQCGLIFEGWFADRADFDRQSGEGIISCPDCGGGEILKVLSPVRSLRAGKGDSRSVSHVAMAASPEGQAMQVLRTLQEYVLTNFEDVGANLAAESLKLHYGLGEPRNIRGVATEAEEEMLKGEGIELLKIPLPEKKGGDA